MKLALRDERGAVAARRLLGVDGDLVTLRVATVEVRCALAAARRAGRLPPGAGDVAGTMRELDLLALDAPLCDAAGDLGESHALRALDALHLAAALRVRERLPQPVALIAWDRRLRRAAQREGLAVLPKRL